MENKKIYGFFFFVLLFFMLNKKKNILSGSYTDKFLLEKLHFLFAHNTVVLTVFALDPSNSVIKRSWCICTNRCVLKDITIC